MSFKEKAEQKAKELKEKATEATKNIDTSKLKAQAENATGEFNKMDNKKKGLIGGGVAVAVLVLLGLSFGGGSDLSKLEQAFPADASGEVQCRFYGDYEGEVLRATLDKSISLEEIHDALNAVQEPKDGNLSKAHSMFIGTKKTYFDKVENVKRSLNSESNQKKLAEMDVEKEIKEEADKAYKSCMRFTR